MIKTCVICGLDFKPKPHLQRRQICCCKECSSEQNRRTRKKYHENNKDKLKEKKKEYEIANREKLRHKRKLSRKPYWCEICGKPVERIRYHDKARTHDECLLNKCAEYIKKGEKLPNNLWQKAYCRGYDMYDIRERAGV